MEILMTLVEKIEYHQLMIAIRTDTPEQAYKAAEACRIGGVKFIEITFSVPQADEVIQKLSQQKDAAIIGAGTVLTVAEAKKAIRAGARYIVSPIVDEKVIKFTKKEGILSIPGACTPAEIYTAYKVGGDIIKLFPFVEIGGLNFLKVIRGPFPFIRYMLSGGVNLDNITEYVKAGASCILIGSAIIKKELVKAEDWDTITERAKQFVLKVEEHRSVIK
jgi:2-dehydro-3-deoxyphosphogluconate aldolase / (4S)-4-hydroxy-2-oxoglutarate aldolase